MEEPEPKTSLQCPQCGSKNVANILYGITDISPELEKEIQEGSVILGGCSVFYDEDEEGNQIQVSPRGRCNQCEAEIF